MNHCRSISLALGEQARITRQPLMSLTTIRWIFGCRWYKWLGITTGVTVKLQTVRSDFCLSEDLSVFQIAHPHQSQPCGGAMGGAADLSLARATASNSSADRFPKPAATQNPVRERTI